MNKICCFGELLLRMSPALNGQWIHDALMPVYIGGAELNVANALALWKLPVKYVSSLPDNRLAMEIKSALSKNNIDTSCIHSGGDRIGIYFLPQGSELKHEGVIYDRSHSSFSLLTTGMLDWGNILHNVSWLHFSAIVPALNAELAKVCEEALVCASKKNITISIDLNHRAKLWQYGEKPADVIPALAKYCNVVMGNIWSANSLLGIDVDENIHDKKSKEAYLQHATQTANAIMKKFPKCEIVANTFRFDADDGIHYFASINNNKDQVISKKFYIKNIVDKIGTGDCFMAALIYGLYNHHPLQKIIDFAATAATGKMSETGDSTKQSVDAITKQIQHEST